MSRSWLMECNCDANSYYLPDRVNSLWKSEKEAFPCFHRMPTFVTMQKESKDSTHINLSLLKGIQWTLNGESSLPSN